MIKNYFIAALRFLNKNRLFGGISMLGLSIALACSFIMLLFVINELSYDRFHKKEKQIYRIIEYRDNIKRNMAGTPYVLSSAMKEEFPQVEKASSVRRAREFKLKLNEEYISEWGATGADSDLFEIFSLPLVRSPLNDQLLEDLNSIVLSRDLAEKYFPGEDAVGREIEALINEEEQLLIVTGVYENIPGNSTLRASCLINNRWTLDPINTSFNITDADMNWRMDFWTNYILVSEDCNLESIEKEFRALEEKNNPAGYERNFKLQKLSDVYLGSEDVSNSHIKGNRKNVQLFGIIAGLIVLIAAVNYILLSTAVSASRAKEIGIRKTNGASNRSIQNQLLSESIILSFLVLPLAIILMWIAIPGAEKLFNTKLTIYASNVPVYILVYFLLTVLIGFASGLYTSSFLSRLDVMSILNNSLHSGRKRQLFRSVLIVFQLVVFCSFVSGTLIIRSQYKYALSMQPGFDTENIIQVNLGSNFKEFRPFIEKLNGLAEVKLAAGTFFGLPMQNSMINMVPHMQNSELMVRVESMSVDYNFLETMGIEVNGRYFSREFGSDLEEAVIVNEKALEALGIEDPVGSSFMGRTIIGVAKDFNIHSIHTEVPPLTIKLTDTYIQDVAVKYEAGTLHNLIPKIKKVWDDIAPDRIFQYSLVEDLLEEIYASEKRLGTIISVSAIFALLIASMGIFGLTLFVARSRTKEIGIRKVFGSGEHAIVFSFLRSNFILVLIAGLISVPITIYFMNNWLQNYPFRINISPLVFILSFVIAAMVVLFAVGVQSFRAARLNPVDALRIQ